MTVVTGATQDEALLERMGAGRARALIDLTHTVQETLDLCRLASERFEIPIVISRIGDVDLVPQLRAMGVKVVQPALATAMALEGRFAIRRSSTCWSTKCRTLKSGRLSWRNGSLVNHRVREVRLPGNALIVSLERDQTIMVPHGDTMLEDGRSDRSYWEPGCRAAGGRLFSGDERHSGCTAGKSTWMSHTLPSSRLVVGRPLRSMKRRMRLLLWWMVAWKARTPWAAA